MLWIAWFVCCILFGGILGSTTGKTTDDVIAGLLLFALWVLTPLLFYAVIQGM
jgi:predicted permease